MLTQSNFANSFHFQHNSLTHSSKQTVMDLSIWQIPMIYIYGHVNVDVVKSKSKNEVQVNRRCCGTQCFNRIANICLFTWSN